MKREDKTPPARPLLQVNVSRDEWETVAAAANHIEIPVNTLARALFRWAWPLFKSRSFSVAELKASFGEDERLVEFMERTSRADKIKDWLYRLYLATPEDERDVFRGLAEKIHVEIDAPEGFGAVEGTSKDAEADDQGHRHAAGRGHRR